MTMPLDFLPLFRERLRGKGISFALTSGMACVHYGLQQTTKDSDWIIGVESLPELVELLVQLENGLPKWRVSYRQLFGAPLTAEYMQNGWTSHLLIQDEAASAEHKVDIFCRPPRVARVESDAEGWASREVVAMMKRTDRDRDWPIVDGLAWQMAHYKDGNALVHLQNAERLIDAWAKASPAERVEALGRRPLLRLLEKEVNADRIAGYVRVERLIWECVNVERYSAYTKLWKAFYREWRKEEDWMWPTSEPFDRQHTRLLQAAHRLRLEIQPIPASAKQAMIERALTKATARALIAREIIDAVTPPLNELLP